VDLEERLLKELADSTGNILENKTLIESLNNTKEKSQIVTKSLKRSSNIQQELDEKREVFKPISDLGSKMYLALGILNKLSNMYRYSLSQFIVLFNEALDSSNDIEKVKQALIDIVFNNVAIGLMKTHRILLALIFAK
jgi:dynein heavy chain 2